MLEHVEESQIDEQTDHLPVICLPGDITKGCIILCDHASNALPSAYGTLGLSGDELVRHIAYDIGAKGVVSGLSRLMGVPAIITNFSRLLIDPNRGFDDPTLVMRISDGAVVPGNANVDATEIEFRTANFYRPYHDAIDLLIDKALAAGTTPTLVSIHSFTEALKGHERPWHAGVLWDKDDRLPRPLIEALRQDKEIIVGDNEPYSGELKGDCLYQHGTQRGLAHALIEIRQDIIREPAGQRTWAELLARMLTELFSHPKLAAEFREIRYFGSNTEKGSPGKADEKRNGRPGSQD